MVNYLLVLPRRPINNQLRKLVGIAGCLVMACFQSCALGAVKPSDPSPGHIH
jgi:hypothetical protein